MDPIKSGNPRYVSAFPPDAEAYASDRFRGERTFTALLLNGANWSVPEAGADASECPLSRFCAKNLPNRIVRIPSTSHSTSPATRALVCP